MSPASREEEIKKAERLKDEHKIDEWLLEEAIRSGQTKPMQKIKTEFDPKFCEVLVEVVAKYRQQS